MNQENQSLKGPLIILGADSRAAAAITARFPETRVVGVARRPGAGERLVVDDYATVPDDAPLTGAQVINCVGSDRGTPEDLHKLNCAVPVAWARAARDRGAEGFVHLSSFSVFARQGEVGMDSPLDTRSDYGRSKRAAEEELKALAGEGFAVSRLRMPILVSPPVPGGPDDKLGLLMKLVRVSRLRPRLARPIARAMLSYDGLAEAVCRLVNAPQPLTCAADPEPFSYELVGEVARNSGIRLASVPLPGSATALVARFAPGLHERLFTSMALADDDNLLAQGGNFLRLRAIVGMHFARSGRS